MGLERRKASLGSELKANASGAINFTLSRTYLPLSFLLSPPLSLWLFLSFTLALLFPYLPLVQFNCLHQLCCCCYSSPDCRALCGWRRLSQQFAHPSSLRPHSPKQYATQIFHYCNCRHLAASRYRYSCHTPCVVLFDFCHIALCASRRITRAFSIL